MWFLSKHHLWRLWHLPMFLLLYILYARLRLWPLMKSAPRCNTVICKIHKCKKIPSPAFIKTPEGENTEYPAAVSVYLIEAISSFSPLISPSALGGSQPISYWWSLFWFNGEGGGEKMNMCRRIAETKMRKWKAFKSIAQTKEKREKEREGEDVWYRCQNMWNARYYQEPRVCLSWDTADLPLKISQSIHYKEIHSCVTYRSADGVRVRYSSVSPLNEGH